MAAPGAPRVIVTRPRREALAWGDALRARGLAVEAWPLIEIAPAADPDALARAWASWPSLTAAMFVSANAVEGFLAAAPAQWHAGSPGPRCWSTGPGTARALGAAGVPATSIDTPPPEGGRFDSEALWEQVQSQVGPGARVLRVRGADAQGMPAGRDWLSERLADAGVQVDTVAAYRRVLPAWDAVQRERAVAALDAGAWWLLSSSEAVANLLQLLPPQAAFSRGRALCTHERIARAARDAGFGTIAQVPPLLAQVAAFLQSNP